ncbi:MAG: aminoacyl-tRNA hydrolase [Firmicutes bacterium]|nr:aminoacyl-tRNA hydrolase [Bacillota bacterium]
MFGTNKSGREHKLIIGLGNPGEEYSRTRHNLGFMAIDHLSSQWGIPVRKSKYQALWGEGRVGVAKVVLIKPQTFMNLSGQAVKGFVQAYQLTPQDILVIYDDLDLPVGRIRLRARGGAGGHRGLQSIIQLLGTDQFSRIRIGIGRPPSKTETVDYVLHPFLPAEQEVIDNILSNIHEVVETWLEQGIEVAMNQYNAEE